ncbi:hypothetical protein [Spirochaeta cellobiosiphila]|nr:hypothetical protein [Spirochaeta cellobiosiphila]
MNNAFSGPIIWATDSKTGKKYQTDTATNMGLLEMNLAGSDHL